MTRYHLTLLACVTLTAMASHAKPSVNQDKNGLAVHGYDPVAYFPKHGGEATKGKKTITAEFAGATFRFANETHRDLFVAQPENFVPAYGGWCAYAMAEGERVKVDPKRFEVHDGRLYLFYRDWFTDTLKPWHKNRDELRERADDQWVRQHQDVSE